MHKMQMSQINYQQKNSYNQYRPYSQDYDMSDNMPMPMKWMMKMMMKNDMDENKQDYADKYDVMKSRSNNPMDSRLDKIEALLKHALNTKMNRGQNYMKNSQHKEQGMYGDMFDMKNSDLDFSSLFSQRQRHARAAGNSLDLGDRLVEKLQRQKQEMEEKVGNLTCILKEVNVLDASNDISVLGMKKDLEKYELPSAWFKANYEALMDTCYEMATPLPAELNDGHIVTGEFGSVNIAQVKAFRNCWHKGKAKLCMNQDYGDGGYVADVTYEGEAQYPEAKPYSPPAAPAYGVAGLGEDWGLTSQRLQHLSCTSKSVTRLSHADVETKLPDPEVPHRVLGLVLASLNHFSISCRSESSNISLV